MMNTSFIIFFGIFLIHLPALASLPPGLSPEAEALQLSKILKPIPDDQWKTIAGDKAEEKYVIIRGDNLFDISKRLFGDGRYWPKIWALNNNTITNPHLIRPENSIVFIPGSGSSLPSVSLKDASMVNEEDEDAEDELKPESSTEIVEKDATAPQVKKKKKKKKSEEWKMLPPQGWEKYLIKKRPEIDPLGFDSRNKISWRKDATFTLNTYATTDRIETTAQIIGSTLQSLAMTMGDTVYLQSNGNLQVGDLYAVAEREPQMFGPETGRRGFIYTTYGQIKVLGVRDNLFVGTITQASDVIKRNMILIPEQKRAKILDPIPGPDHLQGTLYLSKEKETTVTTQHKVVFIDRGTDDGVMPGMIFRLYQYEDPYNNSMLTESDFIPYADISVIHSTPRFCTGVVIFSQALIANESRVTLLTDVADLKKSRSDFFKTIIKPDASHDVNDLEMLESTDSIGKREKKELRQLEKWDGNEAIPVPPAPTEEGIPPQPGDLPLPAETPPATGDLPPAAEVPPAPSGELPPAGDLPPAEDLPAGDDLPPPSDLPTDLPAPSGEAPPGEPGVDLSAPATDDLPPPPPPAP